MRAREKAMSATTIELMERLTGERSTQWSVAKLTHLEIVRLGEMFARTLVLN